MILKFKQKQVLSGGRLFSEQTKTRLLINQPSRYFSILDGLNTKEDILKSVYEFRIKTIGKYKDQLILPEGNMSTTSNNTYLIFRSRINYPGYIFLYWVLFGVAAFYLSRFVIKRRRRLFNIVTLSKISIFLLVLYKCFYNNRHFGSLSRYIKSVELSKELDSVNILFANNNIINVETKDLYIQRKPYFYMLQQLVNKDTDLMIGIKGKDYILQSKYATIPHREVFIAVMKGYSFTKLK